MQRLPAVLTGGAAGVPRLSVGADESMARRASEHGRRPRVQPRTESTQQPLKTQASFVVKTSSKFRLLSTAGHIWCFSDSAPAVRNWRTVVKYRLHKAIAAIRWLMTWITSLARFPDSAQRAATHGHEDFFREQEDFQHHSKWVHRFFCTFLRFILNYNAISFGRHRRMRKILSTPPQENNDDVINFKFWGEGICRRRCLRSWVCTTNDK